MSVAYSGPCVICGKTATKSPRGKGNCKVVCPTLKGVARIAHRECLDNYCVLCYAPAQNEAFKVCTGCGAKIHESCAKRESRRPAHGKLNHSWTGNTVGGGRSIATELEEGPGAEDIIAEMINHEHVPGGHAW